MRFAGGFNPFHNKNMSTKGAKVEQCEFIVGEEVECISVLPGYTTAFKEYKINKILPEVGRVSIIDDKGNECHVKWSRFRTKVDVTKSPDRSKEDIGRITRRVLMMFRQEKLNYGDCKKILNVTDMAVDELAKSRRNKDIDASMM